MDGDQARPLLEHGQRFKHLRRLDLSFNQIDDATASALRDTYGDAITVAEQTGLSSSAALALLAF